MTDDLLTDIKDRLPAGWALLPLKRVAAIRYGLGQPPPEITDGVPLLRATNVNRGKITDAGLIFVNPTGVPLGRDARLIPGEIIVVRSGAYTGDSAIVPARFDQALAGYDMVVRAKSTDPRFLAWQLLSEYVANFQFSLSKSRAAQPHLNAEELGETLVCQPPPFSQRRIADFLDRETAKIDTLIAKQTEFLELLYEHRRAFVTEAVTKGLDPSVPVQETGIELFTTVPAHWQVDKIGRLAMRRSGAIKAGPFGSQLLASEMTEGDVKVYAQSNAISGDFSSGDNFVSEQKARQLKAFFVFPRDLLVTTRGTIGRAAIVPEMAESGVLHPCLIRVQFDERRMVPEFAKFVFNFTPIILSQIEKASNATTIEVIYTETMRSLILPVPPVAEQLAIIGSLTERLSSVNRLAEVADDTRKRLVERRSALITAAVTGQIDVTQSAPKLAAA